MKTIQLTENELRTLLCAIQAEHAKYTLIDARKGKNPREDETIQRLTAISKKAYAALVEGKDLTK